MKNFYIISRGSKEINLSEDSAEYLALFCPSTILTKDIREWQDKAKHLDVFGLNHTCAILCLDLDFDSLIRNSY